MSRGKARYIVGPVAATLLLAALVALMVFLARKPEAPAPTADNATIPQEDNAPRRAEERPVPPVPVEAEADNAAVVQDMPEPARGAEERLRQIQAEREKAEDALKDAKGAALDMRKGLDGGEPGKAESSAARARQAADRAAQSAQRARELSTEVREACREAKRTLEKADESKGPDSPAPAPPKTNGRALDRLTKDEEGAKKRMLSNLDELERQADGGAQACEKTADLADRWADAAEAGMKSAGGKTSGAPDGAGALRPGAKIDPRDIPELPTPPPTATRPSGVIPPPKGSDKSVDVLGAWEQVSDGAGPDFLPGGYSRSVLVFRADGVLEVQRSYGRRSTMRQTWRVSYSWEESGGRLVLGKDTTLRPPPASLREFADDATGIRTISPTQSLPLALPCTLLPNGEARIADKVYRRLDKAE